MATPLVYPRQLPTKVTSSFDGIDGEDTSDPTVMDYLKISIFDSQKGNPYTFVNGGPGLSRQSRLKGGDTLVKTIYLYLPTNLSESYNTNYNEVSLGPAGAAGLEALSGNKNNGGDGIKTLQQFANTAAPQFAAGAAASALGAVNSALGLGAGPSANDLVGIASKSVFNPYQEVTFQGVSYREHSFNFKMVPKNYQEANECHDIVNTLRRAMLPNASNSIQNSAIESQVAQFALGTNNNTLSGARYLNIPDYFRLEVVRVAGDPEKGLDNLVKGGRLKQIMQFPTKLVLSGFNLNLTPDGQMNTLKDVQDGVQDYGPAAMDLSLTFKETSFITRNMLF